MIEAVDEALEVIKQFEGFSSTPYLCPAGVATIGYGSIYDKEGKRVTLDHPEITEMQASDLMLKEVYHCARVVLRLVTVPLNVNQLTALIDFVYNLGSGSFQRSTLRMKLNRGDYDGTSNEFWKWRRANGIILRGLVRRRAVETLIFNS